MSKHPDAFTVDREVLPHEALADPKLVARAIELHVLTETEGGLRGAVR